jgi:transposase
MCQEPELITRRRRWSPTQKAALLEEVEDEGGKVAVVARRHGISESLLYNRRSAWTAAASEANAAESVAFVVSADAGLPARACRTAMSATTNCSQKRLCGACPA